MANVYLNIENGQIKSLLIVNYKEMWLLALLLLPTVLELILAPILADYSRFLPYLGYVVTFYIIGIFLIWRDLPEFQFVRTNIHFIVVLTLINTVAEVYYLSDFWENILLNVLDSILDQIGFIVVWMVFVVGFKCLIHGKINKKEIVKLACLGILVNVLFQIIHNLLYIDYYSVASFVYSFVYQMQIPDLGYVIIVGAVSGIINYYFFKRIENFLKVEYKELYVFGSLSAFFIILNLISAMLNYTMNDELVLNQFVYARLSAIVRSLEFFLYGVGFYSFNKLKTTPKQPTRPPSTET